MINNPVIFYIASSILVVFAINSMFQKNIIYSLLSAIMVFFAGAIIFYVLGSEYNAIVQAAIYGLAVPVIIGVSVMFTVIEKESSKIPFITCITLATGILFALVFICLIMMSNAILPGTFRILDSAQISFYDTITAFTKGLFIKYVWGFEVVSLLLVIVIAGFSILNKKERL